MPLPSKHRGIPLSSSQQQRWEELYKERVNAGIDPSIAAPVAWKEWEKEYRLDVNKGSWKRIVSQGVQRGHPQ